MGFGEMFQSEETRKGERQGGEEFPRGMEAEVFRGTRRALLVDDKLSLNVRFDIPGQGEQEKVEGKSFVLSLSGADRRTGWHGSTGYEKAFS